jgi:hypothetical protein
MKCAEPTRLHRKSGTWGTQDPLVRTEAAEGKGSYKSRPVEG